MLTHPDYFFIGLMHKSILMIKLPNVKNLKNPNHVQSIVEKEGIFHENKFFNKIFLGAVRKYIFLCDNSRNRRDGNLFE